MEFNNKINNLKALAIILVVSGHCSISLIPFFPTYSFHMALFFFISGYLFKEKHFENIFAYIKNKAKRLLIPCYIYTYIYLIISLIIYKFSGLFLGFPISIMNYVINPMIIRNPLALTSALWFIPQLFISISLFILIYKLLKKIWDNKFFHFTFFLILALLAIFLSTTIKSEYIKIVITRTLFTLFFIYLGVYYKNFIENKHNIFNYKWTGSIIIIQSILWLFNVPYKGSLGLANNLAYLLYEGNFNHSIIPLLTSITGIWVCLFIIEMLDSYLKNNKFVKDIGQNTYHIMANHIIIIYLISLIILHIKNIKGIIYSVLAIYNPIKSSYVYFILALVISNYIGIIINKINAKMKNRKKLTQEPTI